MCLIARYNYSSLRLIFLKCITLKVFNYPKQVIPVWITFHLKTPTWKLPEITCWPACACSINCHSFHYINVSLVYRYIMDNILMFTWHNTWLKLQSVTFAFFVAISVWKPGIAVSCGIIFRAWGCDPVFRHGSGADESNVLRWMCSLRRMCCC